MINAAIYTRYSSDKQTSASTEAQVYACRRYCKQKGYRVVAVFSDEATTGTTIAGRDQFTKMLEDARRGFFDVIVMHKIDRAARNELDYYRIREALLRSGVRYEYAEQNIDSSRSGQLMEGMLVLMAADYSRNLRDETKKGMDRNARHGKFNGGIAPLGFDIVNGEYVVNEYEAQAVRLIFDRAAAGSSYTKIMEELNQKGYRTKRGSQFGKNSLHDILVNPKYIGTYTFNRTPKAIYGRRNSHGKPAADYMELPDALPAIVDKEVFAVVQAKLHKAKHSNARAKRMYLLSGILRCAECGAAMSGTTTVKNSGKVYRYYHCTNKDNKGSVACENFAWRCEVLENAVLDCLIEKVFSLVNEKQLEDLIEVQLKKEQGTDKLGGLRARQQALTSKMDRLYCLIEDKGDRRDFARLRAVQQELDVVEAELADAEAAARFSIDAADALLWIKKYRAMLEARDDEEQLRKFVLSYIESVSIDKKGKALIQLSVSEKSMSAMVPGNDYHGTQTLALVCNVPRLLQA